MQISVVSRHSVRIEQSHRARNLLELEIKDVPAPHHPLDHEKFAFLRPHRRLAIYGQGDAFPTDPGRHEYGQPPLARGLARHYFKTDAVLMGIARRLTELQQAVR